MLPCEKYWNKKAVRFCLQVNIYKYSGGVNHYVIYGEFNVDKNLLI